MLYAILRGVLNKAFKSWTVWAGLAITVITSIQPVVDALMQAAGNISPALAAKVAALTMLATRLRTVVLPVLKDLMGEK